MTYVSCGSFVRPLSPNPLEQLILAEDNSMEVDVLCLTVSLDALTGSCTCLAVPGCDGLKYRGTSLS